MVAIHSWLRIDIQSMIGTLAVDCTSLLGCSNDEVKSAADTACNEMVVRAVGTSHKFSLLASQHNNTYPSCKMEDNGSRKCYMRKSVFPQEIMSTSVNSQVDELFTRDSYQLQDHKIHSIHIAMVVQVYGSEQITTTK